MIIPIIQIKGVPPSPPRTLNDSFDAFKLQAYELHMIQQTKRQFLVETIIVKKCKKSS